MPDTGKHSSQTLLQYGLKPELRPEEEIPPET